MTGRITGPGGAGVLNVNVNAVESTTRAGVRLAHDDTDSLGAFTVVVPPGTYDFEYDPPGCTGFAPTAQPNVTVSAPTTLPTAGVVTGVHVRGSVIDGLSQPVGAVDLDVFPAGGTAKLYTPNDQTLADGSYDLLIAPGTYDIKYIPSSLTRLRPVLRTSVAVPASQTLATVTLVNGWRVSGTVRDASRLTAIGGVTVDFYAPGSPTPLLVTHHTTATDGTYDVVVDAGTWDVRYTPAPGAGYGVATRPGVAVSADVALGDQLLQPGTSAVPMSAIGRLTLSPAMPNPVRHDTRFVVETGGGDAELAAWDVAGRRAATLWRGRAVAPMVVRWNGTSDRGAPLPAGLYLVRLMSPRGGMAVRRVLRVP